jgi:hypothetical protein
MVSNFFKMSYTGVLEKNASRENEASIEKILARLPRSQRLMNEIIKCSGNFTAIREEAR